MSNRRKLASLAQEERVIQPRAALGYVHPGEVTGGFFYSVVRAFAHEIGAHGAPFALIGEICPSGQLVDSRNDVTKYFLDRTDLEWLWWCDTDMGFEADSLSRLIASADPVERPVIGGLCFGLRRSRDDFELQAYEHQCFPTLYTWEERDDEVGFRTMVKYPKDALVEVGATGAAFLLVHRSVLEAIRAKYGDVWFDTIQHPKGARFSEDISFCIRVAGVDKPLFVDTGIKTSHAKGGVYLREQEFELQQAVVETFR